jgi:uncharacterized repeat protein (TIGR02543 family)
MVLLYRRIPLVWVTFFLFLSISWAQSPTITSFSPTSGSPGTLVTVTGTNLINPSSFSIGGVSAIVISNTGTSLVGMVMPGATTGDISLTVSGGTVSSETSFTVTATTYPQVQQGNKLVGTGAIGVSFQGTSVSVSADGNTAIVGGMEDDSYTGAVWIYVKSGGLWVQQGSRLVGTDAVGAARQGSSVALSADGNTAIVGGSADGGFGGVGAAWIFTRSGGVWSQQGDKLVGSDALGSSSQGYSVSISANGNTAIIGAPTDNDEAEVSGAAWVFTRSSGVWTQQGNKLVGTSGRQQGWSVSMSADGTTAIVGCPGGDGGAWVFTHSAGIWSQQQKLVGSGVEGISSGQGVSVSLSADGNTAIVGGSFDNNYIGAAWVFTRTGNTWVQEEKLVGSTDAIGRVSQGGSVSLSADGNTAIIGGVEDDNFVGAAWVFTRSGSSWTQQGSKLIGTGASGSAGQGIVSLSSDGKSAFIGGTGDNSGIGAAWVFTSNNSSSESLVPTITSFSPTSGSPGTLVTISGTNLSNPSAFSIGGVSAIVISNTGTSLVGMVMPGATTGVISLTASGSTVSSASGFTVTATAYPQVQQGSKLVGTGATGTARQGFSVSLSKDGNTALVGGYADNSRAGAAWVYTRSGGVWTQQGSKLVGAGAIGTFVDQGTSVSLSADGNTAIVGGNSDNSNIGAAWVFTRISGVWTQQGDKLVGTGAAGNARQGYSVSLSADGNTALVGGYADNSNAGAAWVYTRSGGVWTQQGNKLVGTDATGAAFQGYSVSLSADGNTALVGGYADNSNAGATWVYTRSSGVWTQQGNKLVGTGTVGAARQGTSVSLSTDGNTAIVGGNSDNSNIGAVWVFTRTSGVWTQQGNKLVGTGVVGAAFQGKFVSLSADGNTAIVGGYGDNSGKGAAWVFTRIGGVWNQQSNKLVGTGAAGATQQGYSVSLSADGNTAIVGGYGDNSNAGAIWVYTTGIVYNGNGQTGGTAPSSYAGDIGSSVNLSGNTGSLVKTGYSFNGWNTQADGNGTAYAVGSAYTLTGSVTLYADWELLPQPPTITSFSPSSGSSGTLVTVTGTNLSNPSSFSIGGVTAIVISNTGTSLVGMVMPGASTGSVAVTTGGGTASGPVNFTVTATAHPGVQLGNKLAGVGSGVYQRFGHAVAISGDGNTVVVGAPGDNNLTGYVQFFIKSGGAWVQQGTRMVGTGAIGYAHQGCAVAISADGNTVIVGGELDDQNKGAVWIFTRSGGVWSQQGDKLVGTGAAIGALYGNSVSLSADGNTALVGGYFDNSFSGAAWVYTRSGGVWTQQGNELVVSDAVGSSQFGSSVALSADGQTALIGGVGDNSGTGAVWVFARSGSTWSQQGNKLVGTATTGTIMSHQGRSVALSADGKTAVFGVDSDIDGGGGGILVFVNDNGVWTQQGDRLRGPSSRFNKARRGSSVAISADGNTILMGAGGDDNDLGASFIFTRQQGVWSLRPGRLVGADAVLAPKQGMSVSLSADGSTAIVGGGDDNQRTVGNNVQLPGAAWIFVSGENDFVWNGSVGNAWSDAANWTPAQVPSSQNNIRIPAGLTNYPVANGNLSVYELILEAGTELNLSFYTLTVKGGMTNNGRIFGTGKLLMAGTIAQQVDGNGSVENIEMNNSSLRGLYIATGDNKLNVTGIFTPTNGLTYTEGNLVFKSSATQEAKIGTCSYCPIEPFSGEVTVEKYIPAKRAFRFITPGVTTSQNINWNWQERSIVSSTAGYPYLNGLQNPLPGYGTHITGVGGSVNGFDVTLANSPSLFTFDVPSYAWVAESNTNVVGNVLKRGEAYRIMIKGSRAANLNENPYAPDATTLRTTGTLKVCESMTFTTSSPVVPLSSVASRFSFIGNPFWSVVDWHAVSKANIESNFYYWDPTIQGTNGRGAYVTYNEVNASNNVVGSSVDRYIQPGQAFFVRNNADVSGSVIPSVTFDYTDVVGNTPARTSIFSKNGMKAGVEMGFENANTTNSNEVNTIQKIFVSLLIKAKMDSGPADGFLLTYSTTFSDTYGSEDAMKFGNLDENISALFNGNWHSILGLMSVDGKEVKSDTIPISMSNLYDGEYVLRVGLDKSVKSIYSIQVINRVSGEVFPVDLLNGLDLSFMNAAGVKTKDDLALVVNFRPALPPAPIVKKLVAYPNPVLDGNLNLIVPIRHVKSLQELKKARIEIRTVNKRLVLNQQLNLNELGNASVNIASLVSGIYVIHVSIDGKTFTEKIIKQ